MSSSVVDEFEFFRRFVTVNRRGRCMGLLESPKGRLKLVERLDHFDDFDKRFTYLVPPSKQSAAEIERLLRVKGAPEYCHVMSSNSDIDNKHLQLLDALERTVGMFSGTVISCIPGKLAYFEGEEANRRIILERRS